MVVMSSDEEAAAVTSKVRRLPIGTPATTCSRSRSWRLSPLMSPMMLLAPTVASPLLALSSNSSRFISLYMYILCMYTIVWSLVSLHSFAMFCVYIYMYNSCDYRGIIFTHRFCTKLVTQKLHGQLILLIYILC